MHISFNYSFYWWEFTIILSSQGISFNKTNTLPSVLQGALYIKKSSTYKCPPLKATSITIWKLNMHGISFSVYIYLLIAKGYFQISIWFLLKGTWYQEMNALADIHSACTCICFLFFAKPGYKKSQKVLTNKRFVNVLWCSKLQTSIQ